MQIGTRFPVGGEIPSRVPEVMVAAIREHEAELAATGVDASKWRWTLTWLENRPVVDLDDGCVIRLTHDGHAAVSLED